VWMLCEDVVCGCCVWMLVSSWPRSIDYNNLNWHCIVQNVVQKIDQGLNSRKFVHTIFGEVKCSGLIPGATWTSR
jgi:hypothetical protein